MLTVLLGVRAYIIQSTVSMCCDTGVKAGHSSFLIKPSQRGPVQIHVLSSQSMLKPDICWLQSYCKQIQKSSLQNIL